jgi:hypothetical protein
MQLTRKPRPNAQKVTEEQLRMCLAAGMTDAEIAARYGMTRQAINARIKLTGLAGLRPAGTRTTLVRKPIDAMDQLRQYTERLNTLIEACDQWLQDPADPARYHLGPRAHEVRVIYDVEVEGRREKREDTLAALLARVGSEREIRIVELNQADPRELLIRTIREGRQTVAAAVDLARLLVDAQSILAFREVVLAAIKESDPEVSQRIRAAVQEGLVLLNTVRLPDALPLADGAE